MALAVTLTAWTAFAPSSGPHTSSAACRKAVCAQMVTVPEVYESYYSSLPPLQRQLSDTTGPIAQGAMGAVVAGAAAVGYFGLSAVSSRLAVNAVGGAATGGLGLFARSKIAKERKESASPAVAKLLASGMGEVDAAALAAVATEYGVEKKEFKAQLIELYGVFLGACLDSSQVVPSELGEIKKLGGLLSLSRADVGSAFHTAGRRLYSRHRAYLEETEPNDSKALLNKFVFLAERVLSQDESEEGYRYEAMRAQKVFQLSKADWASRAEEVALPFYEKVLDKVVAGQQAITTEQLLRIRADFGVNDERAKDMHAVTY